MSRTDRPYAPREEPRPAEEITTGALADGARCGRCHAFLYREPGEASKICPKCGANNLISRWDIDRASMRPEMKVRIALVVALIVAVSLVITMVVVHLANPMVWSATISNQAVGQCDGDAAFASAASLSDGSIVAVGLVCQNSPDQAAVAAAWTSDGRLLWARAYRDGGLQSFLSVIATKSDDVVAVGTSGKTGDGYRGEDAAVVELTSTGDVVWAHTFGGSGDDTFESVALASNGDLLVVGGTESPDGDFPTPYQPVPTSSVFGEPGDPIYENDAVVARLSATGQLLWAKAVGGSSNDWFYSVAVSADGEIIAVGDTMSTDGDFPQHGWWDSDDAVVARFSADGNLVWARTYGGYNWDYFDAVTIGFGDQVLVAGGTNSTDGDFPTNGPNGHAVCALLTADGDIVWARTYGGTRYDSFTSIAVPDASSILVTGRTESDDGDFPTSHQDSGPLSSGAVIAKLDSDGTLVWKKAFECSWSCGFNSFVPVVPGVFLAVGWEKARNGEFTVSYTTAVAARITINGLFGPR